MTGIQQMFHELMGYDEYQQDLFCYLLRKREAHRVRVAERDRFVQVVPALRERRNAYQRARSSLRRDYWRRYKRTKRGEPKQVHHCGACGGVGHRVTTCQQTRAA